MPQDDPLAGRLRAALDGLPGVSEKRMFGGVCFLLDGNMLGGVHRDRFIFRVGKDARAHALSRPGARPMDLTGRPMAGFVFVDAGACDLRRLRGWVKLARNYVGTMPPKKPRGKARRRAA